MAKKSAAVAIGVVVLLGGAAYLYSSTASAADGDDDDDDGLDPTTGGNGGNGGNGGRGGPGGKGKIDPSIPEPAGGGKTWGDAPPGTTYNIPDDWDPIRGLWISPDCEVVVEAPGWFCGASGDDPFLYGGAQCNSVEFETYAVTMDDPGNGVAGYIYFLIGLGQQPEQIAYQILTEISPLCADLPDNMWPDGLYDWYEVFLERVIVEWESEWGIEFDPDEEVA